MTHADHAAAIKYAFVATGVCGALQRLEDSQAFRPEDRTALARAEEFFQDVMGGVSLVTGNQPAFYSAESISAANRALSTLSVLQFASENRRIQEVLQSFHSQLRELASEQYQGSRDYGKLKAFFLVLSREFADEAIDGSAGEDIPWDEED